MACSVTITSVTGIGPVAGVPTAIRVAGTATDCPTVNLSIHCPGFTTGPVFTGSATVVGGLWTVDVPAPADSGCRCGGRIVIEATCATDPTCTTSFDHTFACEGVCPRAIFQPIAIGDCNPDGTRTVTVSATITSLGPCMAELRDGATVLTSVSGSGTFPISYTGNFSGTVNFLVHFTAPTGCPDILATPIILPGCAVMCPPVTWDPPVIGACDAGGNRSVTVTAHVTSAASFLADLRRGATTLATGSGPGLVNLSNTTTYPGGSTQTFTVGFTSPPAFLTCSGTTTVNVPSCGGSGNGGGGGLCGAFTYVIAVLLGLTLALSILIGTLYCMGVAVPPVVLGIVVGLAIATAAAILAAYLLCLFHICPCLNSCDWLAIVWIASLIGAITALYLGGCCTPMYLVAAGLGLLALIVFAFWVYRCEPSACDIWKHLLVALASGAAVILSYLVLIPIVSACGLSFLPAVVGTVVAGVTIAVATTCH